MTDIYEQYEKAVSGLIPVTRDLINELRLRRMRDEADELLTCFRNNCKKEWVTQEKELISINGKVKRTLCKREGLCILCGKENSLEGKQYCSSCLEMKRQYYYKKIALGICPTCNKEKSVEGKKLCSSCIQKAKKYREKIKNGTHNKR